MNFLGNLISAKERICIIKIMTSKNSSKAFTLPELLLVAVILGYSLSVVLLSFINCLALDEASRNLTSATAHAEYVMEDIKNTAFSNIATNISNGNWTWNTAAVTSNGLTALNSESITTSSTGSNPVDVIVTVSWNDTQGGVRSKRLRTLISG